MGSRASEHRQETNRVSLSSITQHKDRRLERIMMAEAGAAQASLSLLSLPSKPDCFGSTVTSYSEGSAAMDMCVKTELKDQDISQPAYCTEAQGFSAEEMDSGLHLDTEHIKTETVMVKIMDNDDNLQLCSNTEELCPPSQQLNSSTGLLFTQCKSETREVKVKQHHQIQESSGREKEVNKAADHTIKEEYADIQVHELISVSCTLSRQCNAFTGEVKVEQCSFTELEKSVNSEGDGIQTVDVSEHPASPVTGGTVHTGSEEPWRDSMSHRAQEWKCVQCRKVFNSHSSLQSHLQAASCDKHCCLQCGISFPQNCCLKQHQLFHSSEKPYKCIQCGKSFSHYGNIKRHKLLHCKCIYCGSSFLTGGILKEYQRIHSTEKPYKCDLCRRRFSDPCDLRHHQHIHSGEKPFKCSVCGKGFSHGRHLKQHQVVHSGEKPYKCSECERSYSRENALKLHQRLHSGDKPYKCSYCGVSFPRSDYLNQHQRIHTGEKPYKCSECGKSFSRRGSFRQHQRIHTGERPYVCYHCGRSFAVRNSLKQHEETHKI